MTTRAPLYTIITSENQAVPSTRIVCLDLDSIGDVEKSIEWLDRNARSLGSIVIIAAAGRQSQNLTNLVRRVDGVVCRPIDPGDPAWDLALVPILLALEKPTHDDSMTTNPHGGISSEEFSETMFQASLLDEDPRKKD